MLRVGNKVIHMFGHKVFRFIVLHTERRTVPSVFDLLNNRQGFFRSRKKLERQFQGPTVLNNLPNTDL